MTFVVAGRGLAGAATPRTWTDSEVAAAINVGSSAQIESITCPSSSFCVAGGQYFAANRHSIGIVATYDGATWTVTQVGVDLATVPTSQVLAVQCLTSSFCMAAGEFTNDSGAQQAFAARFDGTAWSDVALTGATIYESVSSVSCASTSMCVIGGSAIDDNGAVAHVWLFDGTTWSSTDLAVALNTGHGGARVTAVSCTSATFCVAGGLFFGTSYSEHAFVSVFDGTSWSDQEVAGALNTGGAAIVNAVSCVSATFCVAGGSYKYLQHVPSTTYIQYAFVSVFNGTTWTDSPEATFGSTPKNGGQILAISCVSTTFCAGTGSYIDSAYTTQVFVTDFNGTSWSDQQVAGNLNTAVGMGTAIACSSSTFCAAGGWYNVNGRHHAFAVTYDGTSWSEGAEPGTSNFNQAYIRAMACPTATFCIASGTSLIGDETQSFATVFNGASWSATQLASARNTSGSSAKINAVSCVSATFCMAGGYVTDGTDSQQAYVATFDGTTWLDSTIANGLNADGVASVTALSCVSATFCAAGGTYLDSSLAQAFVSVFDGSTWVDHEVTGLGNALGGSGAQVNALSCASTTLCVAGGTYFDPDSGVQQAFVSVFNGTTWTDSEVAAALNSNDYGGAAVSSVSCGSPTTCVVGGSYTDGDGASEGFVSTFNGTTWTDSEVAADLSQGNGVQVNSLSCPSATFCAAGGIFIDENGQEHAFMAVFNGESWTDTEVAASLDEGGGASTSQVTCTSSTFCVAGGQYLDGNGVPQAFASVFNGVTWTDQEILGDLTGNGQLAINGISCASATSCVATGVYTDSNGSNQGFAASFDGATWTDSEIGGALNVGNAADVTSVSCAADGTCVVGGSYTGAHGELNAFVSSSPTPAAIQIPSAPGTPSLADNHGSIGLTWSAPSSDGGATVTYNVEEQTNHGTWNEVTTGLTAPTYTYQGTTAKSTYSFAIVATNSAGQSAWSPSAYLYATAVKPSIPGTPVLTDHHGSFTATWTPSANNGGDVVTYKVEEQTNHGTWNEVTTGLTAPTYTYQGTTAKSTYSFAIVAANSAGQSAWSTAAHLRAS